MAVGFPTKANWAAGDVLTAAQMDDLAGTVNLFSNASAAAGSQLISNAAGTSVAYQATPSASNPVLNSAFQIWQRSTSVAVTANTPTYTADRWMLQPSGLNLACTVSRQATGDTTNLPNIQYAARVQRNSGQTGTSPMYFGNSFESINSIPYAGKTITLSFYARAGANFSSTSNALQASIDTGTGTDQNIVNGGYTGSATPITGTATLTTTWQRFTYSGTIASTATELGLRFNYSPTGTAGTNDYFEITGVQIDVGSVALPFRTFSQTYQGELAAAQRYYQRVGGTIAYQIMGTGFATSTTAASYMIPLPVVMRTAPSSTLDYSTLAVYEAGNRVAITSATINTSASGASGVQIDAVVASGLTLYRPSFIEANNSLSAYLGFSAEL